MLPVEKRSTRLNVFGHLRATKSVLQMCKLPALAIFAFCVTPLRAVKLAYWNKPFLLLLDREEAGTLAQGTHDAGGYKRLLATKR